MAGSAERKSSKDSAECHRKLIATSQTWTGDGPWWCLLCERPPVIPLLCCSTGKTLCSWHCFCYRRVLEKTSCRVSQTSQLQIPCLPQKSGNSRCVWSCCNLLLQDKCTNSDLRQIKESPCIDASFQIPAAIVQAFQLSPASSWWLPKALLDMQMRHSSGISLDEDFWMAAALQWQWKTFFFFLLMLETCWACTGKQALRKQGFEELTAFSSESAPARLFRETSVERSEEKEGRQSGLLPPVLIFIFLSSCSLTCPPEQSHRLQSEAACLFNHYFSALLKGHLDTGTAQSKKVQPPFRISIQHIQQYLKHWIIPALVLRTSFPGNCWWMLAFWNTLPDGLLQSSYGHGTI